MRYTARMRFARFFALGLPLFAFFACTSSSEDPAAQATPPAEAGTDGPTTTPTPTSDAAPDANTPDAALTGKCADKFGDKLTAAFGRLDGVVYAVQKPSDTQCVMPNSDHLVLQVLWAGGVYRMVVNVESNGADPKVRYGAFDKPLPAPAFAEGWHTDAPLDYVTTLNVHSTDAAFQPYAMNDLVTAVAKELTVGAPIAVYATSGDGRPDSTHLVHRNKTDKDGAIVVDPQGATPKMLLFHFPDQTF